MSPPITTLATREYGFPRVSGDEPMNPIGAIVTAMFSPRERG